MHRIFIGVTAPIIIPPPPPDANLLAQEDGAYLLNENNKYLTLEDN